MPKRTNRPGLSKTDRPPRGMGAGRFRGGRGARGAPAFMGYRGAIRGRGIRYVAPPTQEAPPQVMPIMAQYHPHQPPALGLQFPHWQTATSAPPLWPAHLMPEWADGGHHIWAAAPFIKRLTIVLWESVPRECPALLICFASNGDQLLW